MKEYNCPDCQRTDSCAGCYRLINIPHNVNINKDWPDSIVWREYDIIPSYCRFCQNHPINGGSGICSCVLGMPQVTC